MTHRGRGLGTKYAMEVTQISWFYVPLDLELKFAALTTSRFSGYTQVLAVLFGPSSCIRVGFWQPSGSSSLVRGPASLVIRVDRDDLFTAYKGRSRGYFVNRRRGRKARRLLFNEDDDMKKLVIGCGYLGTRVARPWQAQGDTVYVTTRSQERKSQFDGEGFQAVHLDVTRPETCSRLPAAETALIAVGFDRSAGPSLHQTAVR